MRDTHRATLDSGSTRQFATFSVGAFFFGIEAIRVQEVIRRQDMTPIPLAPLAIRGLINLRGQIVTAIDARHLLSLPALDSDPMNIIIRAEDGAVSLLVDAIGDVLQVPLDSFAPIPDNVPDHQQKLIEGVYALQDRLMLSLHTENLLEIACS